MNKNQKLVQQQFLNNEKEVIRRLRLTYGQALKDVDTNIKNLDMDINGIQVTIDMFDNMGGSPEDKAQLQSMLQSKIYQKQYQEAIHGQIDDVMKKLHKNAYATVDEYVNDCYSEAFIGAAFDLHGQGIPLIMPIDQESVVRAVQLDSKINKGLYFHLGESVNGLKQTIASEVSRGIVNGSTYAQIARQISFKMVGTYQNPGGAMAYAMRIARTEGHRIQCQAGMDACYKAKDMGADVVKQWDSTLDGDTRESHRRVDGEIRELDEPFSNGLDFPGDPSGGAAEVINCRCALLERARWALDDDELETLKQRAEYYGLDKSENFEDFKKKYLKATEQAPALKTQKVNNVLTNKGAKGDIIQSGAKSGALTSKNDPDFKKREAFAASYYEEVLGRKREYEIASVAKNSNMTVEDIDKIFAHVFELEHLFNDGGVRKFEPDYDMAQSWIRLRNGKNIQEHDLILLKHELMEANIMGTGTTIPYDPVHDEVEKTYNYVSALRKYLEENGLV